jgi:uridine kinase
LDTTLQNLLKGLPAQIPKYDFKNRVRKGGEYHVIESPDVVLCEGILMLYRKRIRDAFDMKLFVDVDSDIRLSRQGRCRS